MINRHLSAKIVTLRKQFPVLTLTGPRQTGKTTLLKSIYTDLPYVTLEDIDNRSQALEDPRGFLGNFPDGMVLDEVQYAPDIFSYLQSIVDSKDIHVVLSGSQNFLLSEKINQSLAGRTAILKLLPFSFDELKKTTYEPTNWETQVFNGGYPRLYAKGIHPTDFYPAYINTYIEKDVRQLKNIENLHSFSQFLKLCAGRTGQVLNIHALASDSGISPNTAKAWLSVLEASYIVHFLQPHHKNFNKRLVKSPKLYF
jgi:predicted AAA+ superfamily ATPase